jgi:enamine deaminase RidA (YjgF/YER057c/UK114 family)
MAKIERLCAKTIYDPPAYSQAIRVTGAQTILFLAGQVSYDNAGGVLHPGDFKAQAKEASTSRCRRSRTRTGSSRSRRSR